MLTPNAFIEKLWAYARTIPMGEHPWFKGIVEHRWTKEQIVLGELQHYLRVRGRELQSPRRGRPGPWRATDRRTARFRDERGVAGQDHARGQAWTHGLHLGVGRPRPGHDRAPRMVARRCAVGAAPAGSSV